MRLNTGFGSSCLAAVWLATRLRKPDVRKDVRKGRLDDSALLHTRAPQQKQQIELTVGEGPHASQTEQVFKLEFVVERAA